MFGRKRKPAKVETLIGQHTELRGDILFSGGLHIDGVVKGNVLAEAGSHSLLTLSEHGSVEGEVRAPYVILNGTVVGDVHAAESIELAAHACVNGNVYYSSIEIALGAEVNGQLVHRTDAETPMLAFTRAESGHGEESHDD